ncbi:MAG: xylS, partial [Paenibacillus sp.]|nr:xylS [Paenibacillus sp.]
MTGSRQTELQIDLDNGWSMQITPVAPHTFRIRWNNTGMFVEPPLVHSGILQSVDRRCAYMLERTGNTAVVSTDRAELEIDTQNGHFHLKHSVGDRQLDTHFRPVCRVSVGLSVWLNNEEALYGLGDGKRGQLQLRGHHADMWVHASSPYVPIPYVMSSGGWGMLLTTTKRHQWDIGATDPAFLQLRIPEGVELDLYVFAGSGFRELLDRYTDIAGKPALMPLSAYGLNYSLPGSGKDRDVLNEAVTFRQAGIPCDGINISSGWTKQKDNGFGCLEWDPYRFPLHIHSQSKLPVFIEMLHKHGFKLGVSVECDYDVTGAIDGEPGPDSLASPSGDVRRTGAAKGWYEHLRPIVDVGISYLHMRGLHPWYAHPERQWACGLDDNEVHNMYPVLAAMQTFEGIARHTGIRPHVINSTAGYTGIQQFVATLWGSRAQSREAVFIAVLASGMSGHSNTSINMDLSTREGIHAGFLLPWAQVSPWTAFWSPHLLGDTLKPLFRSYAKLHYRLLPYLYSAASVAAQTGFPVVRAMPLMYPDDPSCRELATQYMLGDSLLVAVHTNTVYLPAGSWIDYWTGQLIPGEQTIEYDIPEGAGGPLFVRAGAIIPQWPDMDYVGQTNVECIELHLYPFGHSAFTLYEDDGYSLRYKEGQAAVTHIACTAGKRHVTVRIERRSGTYEGMPPRRSYSVHLHMCGKPASVKLNGKLCETQKHRMRPSPRKMWQYNRQTETITLHVEEPPQWATEDALLIECLFPSASSRPAPPQLRHASSSPALASERPSEPYTPPELALCRALLAAEPAAVEPALRNWWADRATAQ